MNRGDRAKQFAPFEALGGLRQALTEKEIGRELEIILGAKGDMYDECPEEWESGEKDKGGPSGKSDRYQSKRRL